MRLDRRNDIAQGNVFSGRQKYVCLFIFTNAGVPRASRSEETRRGSATRSRAEGDERRTRVIYSHVELHRRCERLLKLRHHSGRLIASFHTYPDASERETRAVNSASPLLFKTILREVAAPFVAAFSVLPTVRS